MTSEEREMDDSELLVVTAIKTADLECKVAMLAAALERIQDHLSDSELDAEIEEAMMTASEEKKAQLKQERQAA